MFRLLVIRKTNKYAGMVLAASMSAFQAEGTDSNSVTRSNMPEYPSGHKGADLKSVVAKASWVRILPPAPE